MSEVAGHRLDERRAYIEYLAGDARDEGQMGYATVLAILEVAHQAERIADALHTPQSGRSLAEVAAVAGNVQP